MPRLESVPPANGGGMTGDELLRMVGDLVNEHLADISLDDPYRGALYAIACAANTTRRPATVKEAR